MLFCMQSTSVRIDSETHEELKRLGGMSSGLRSVAPSALRFALLRQDRVGEQLAQPVRGPTRRPGSMLTSG